MSSGSRGGRRPVLVIVGGMLGAGKTTLILESARRVAARGLRPAFVTNDQGHGLVDTALADAAGVPAREVAGGCFCCRLSDLLAATDALTEYQPDVVFAEPVGSCTDLAATVVGPLLRDEPWRFRVAPLTVLVDPVRARALAVEGSDPDLAYLFRHQLAEADIVCATKADEDLELPAADGVVMRRLSARTGEGVEAWLDLVLGEPVAVGAKPLAAIDYARYAAAEAALAWLNWHAQLTLDRALSPAVLAGRLAEHLDRGLARAGLAIAHVKLLDQTASGYVRVSLCGDDRDPRVEGALSASPATEHSLLVNARVLGDPAVLAAVIEECVQALARDVRSLRREAFRPAPPRPERRVTGTIDRRQ